MKIVTVMGLCMIMTLAAAGWAAATGTGAGHVHEHGKTEANVPAAVNGDVVYSCPMHPNETSSAQVKCPKCGMLMTKVESRLSYRCSTHTDVVSGNPGKCPICKKALEQVDVPATWKNR